MNEFQKRKAIRAEIARIIRGSHRTLDNVLRIIAAKGLQVSREDFLQEYDVDGNPRPTFIPQNATGCISATWRDKYQNHANHAMNVHTAIRARF